MRFILFLVPIFVRAFWNVALVKPYVCVCYLHTVVEESWAGVIKLMSFFVLECKWDSHLAFVIAR